MGTVIILNLLFLSSTMFAMPGQALEDLEIFAGQDKTVVADMPLHFKDATILKPDPPDPEATYRFSWDFDASSDTDLDGVTDNDGEAEDRYPSWTYRRSGRYTVTLTVTDGTSVARDTLEVTVRFNGPPVLVLEPYQIAACGVPHQLNASANDDNDPAEDLVWEWDLGDGTRSGERAPLVHTYETLGEHTVDVTVTDRSGKSSSGTFQVLVVDETAPVADAGTDLVVPVNGTVFFDGSGSSDNVAVVRYKWSFEHSGELVVLTGVAPNHTFVETGTHVVGLRVEDAAGNADSDTLAVHVMEIEPDEEEGAGGSIEEAMEAPSLLWRRMLFFVVLLAAFVVSALANHLRRSRTGRARDGAVFYRHRIPPRT